MQGLDDILTDIASGTESLIRKLNELTLQNENLQKENNKLKQELIKKGELNLFSGADTPHRHADDSSTMLKETITECIKEVDECLTELKSSK